MFIFLRSPVRQEWTRLALGPGGRVFAVPNADGACEATDEEQGATFGCNVDMLMKQRNSRHE